MQKSLRAGLLVTTLIGVGAVTACGTERHGEITSHVASGIQGGALDTTHSFAIAMVDENKRAFCSGSLIAPNLVMTARHCVASLPNRGVDCDVDEFGAVFPKAMINVAACSVSETCSKSYAAAEIIVPTDGKVCGNDIALVILAKSIPEAEAKPIAPMLTRLTNAKVDGVFTAIGFGVTAPKNDDSGTRRILESVTIACIPGDPDPGSDCNISSPGEVPESEFEGGDGLCQGDSGSSAYVKKSIEDGEPVAFGIASRAGSDVARTQCVMSLYTRTDKWGALIVAAATKAAKAGGYPVPAWTTTLPPPVVTDAGKDANEPKKDAAPPPEASADAGEPVPVSTTTTPTSGCAMAPASSSGYAAGFLALAGLAVVARRRRR